MFVYLICKFLLYFWNQIVYVCRENKGKLKKINFVFGLLCCSDIVIYRFGKILNNYFIEYIIIKSFKDSAYKIGVDQSSKYL